MPNRTFKTRSVLAFALISCLIGAAIVSPANTGRVQALEGTVQPTIVPSPTPFVAAIPSGPIKHIVFFIKENRTFENYFGTYPGANGETTPSTSYGKVMSTAPAKDY